jgi:hypothetical protein
MTLAVWIGIVVCTMQAAMFSGLNLAIFSVSRLRLEIESSGGNVDASRVLRLRRDSNLTLSTVLWGNVAANVLLTLLSKSVLSGILGFGFSTVIITCFGEIMPQAYFARHALRTAARLSPLLKMYQVILFPVAKPTAMLLDLWLGSEAITYFRERDFRALIAQHVKAAVPEMGVVEGRGAVNFLELDDIPIAFEGEPLDPTSVIPLPTRDGTPVFPDYECSPRDPFLQQLQASGRKWVIIRDQAGQPSAALNAHRFLRDAMLGTARPDPRSYSHRPIVVNDGSALLGDLIGRLKVGARSAEDDRIDHDVILLWGNRKRIVTGADLLGRLLRGIAKRQGLPSHTRGLSR